MACVCNRTIARQLANPQFSSVPRHLRMLPASPGEMPAIGTDSRKRVEVITAGDDSDFAGIAGRNTDDLVRCLASLLVPFSDADNPLSIRRDSAISVTQAPRRHLLRCDCLWFSVAFMNAFVAASIVRSMSEFV